MKREELKALGLTDEQVESVMTAHGQSIQSLNTQVASLESERDTAQAELATNQTELDSLKETANGNEELSQKLADLQAKFNESKTNAETQLSEQQKGFAIKLALKEALALDEDIVLGQLDKDTIKVVDGKLQGFDEQLKGLQENKAFLFKKAEEATPPTPTITVGGNAKATGVNTGSLEQQMKSESFNLTEFLKKKGENK